MSRFKQSVWAVLTIGILITSAFSPIQHGNASQRGAPAAASLSLTPSSAAPGRSSCCADGFSLPGPASVRWETQNGGSSDWGSSVPTATSPCRSRSHRTPSKARTRCGRLMVALSSSPSQ